MAGLTVNLANFCSGVYSGTNRTDPIQIAKDVIEVIPYTECTFSVIHKYSGERHVYGYYYGSKRFGTIHVDLYEGVSYTIDLLEGNYTVR